MKYLRKEMFEVWGNDSSRPEEWAWGADLTCDYIRREVLHVPVLSGGVLRVELLDFWLTAEWQTDYWNYE